MKLFQSYLHLGRGGEARHLTQALAGDLNINIEKPSPDIFFISPQKLAISITEVRELKKHIFEKPVKNKYKMVIIEKAHLLTLPAQNALLKILEEPPAHAIIILEAENKGALAQTILSRVVVKNTYRHVSSKKISSQPTHSLEDKLVDASLVEDANSYLENRMEELYLKLLNSLSKDQKKYQVNLICSDIKKHAWAKQLIGANVNPKFALFNLAFSTHS